MVNMVKKRSLINVFKRKPIDEASLFYGMYTDILQVQSHTVGLDGGGEDEAARHEVLRDAIDREGECLQE